MVFLASKIFIHSIEHVMGRVQNTSMSVLPVLLCCICLEFGSATNTITAYSGGATHRGGGPRPPQNFKKLIYSMYIIYILKNVVCKN